MSLGEKGIKMRLILFFGLLSISLCSSAAVYRWVDENGKVHYADEPQQNAELVEVKQNTQNTIALRETKLNSPESQSLIPRLTPQSRLSRLPMKKPFAVMKANSMLL